MADSCHSRGLSWLVKLKPCIPSDPQRHFSTPSPIPTPTPNPTTKISSLPDDLLLDCLVRLPTSSLPSLTLVCRRFLRLVTSPSFASLRRQLNLLIPTLIAISAPSPSSSDLNSLTVSTLRFQSEEFETLTFKLPPSMAAAERFASARAVAIGRSVYLIGQGFMVRYDVWTGLVRVCAAPLFPRKKFAAAAAADGRVLVAGGSARSSAVEEYDPGSDSWRIVAEAPSRRYGCVGATAGGIFYIAGGLKINRTQNINTVDARTCAGSFDAYHIASKTWLHPHSSAATATVPAGGCILALCSIGDTLYIIASHALEVSFWRYKGEGSNSTLSFNRVSNKGGRWERLKPPPVPGQVGTGLRFSCTAIGDSKVAVMVHVLNDSRWRISAAHRQAVAAGSVTDGAVLIYDVINGDWSRGPVVPSGSRRTSCVAVEC